MSRKNKTLRAFLHQTQNPTIKQAWDAAWKHAQKIFHARSMRDMEKQVADLQAENERLHEQLRLATVDQAIAEAEASDAHTENKRLVEALETISEIDYDTPVDDTDTVRLWAACDGIRRAKLIAVKALAAHRKQGGRK